jgi:hypothetical protein
MSTLFVFLLLAGGTAIAAKQLGKKTVGAKQLKKNAVTTAKIKAKAVTKAKIADGAIDSTKLADGSVTTTKIVDGAVTGAKIAPGSTSFGQIVAQFRKSETVPIKGGVYPLGSYVQSPGRDDLFAGAVDFQFEAGCLQPRNAAVYFLIDAANPAAPFPGEIAGFAVMEDKGAGQVTKRAPVTPLPGIGGALYRTAPDAPTTHKFDLLLLSGNCSGGSGVNLTGVTLDVLGTR